jgi:hypothetical protein
MLGLPLGLVLSFTAFGTFLFYQQKHAATFRGSSVAFGAILSIWAGMAKLLGLSIALWIPFMLVEVAVTSAFPSAFLLLSLAGFLVLPICGYLMIGALP